MSIIKAIIDRGEKAALVVKTKVYFEIANFAFSAMNV